MQEEKNTRDFGTELNENLEFSTMDGNSEFPTINENPEFPTMLDELNGIASYLKWSEDAPTISEGDSEDDYLPRGKVRDYEQIDEAFEKTCFSFEDLHSNKSWQLLKNGFCKSLPATKLLLSEISKQFDMRHKLLNSDRKNFKIRKNFVHDVG